MNHADGGPHIPERSVAIGSGGEGRDDVLRMSVDDTNQLRKSLGLKPLRGTTRPTETTVNANGAVLSHMERDEKERLDLTVSETNALRAQLGLKPLRITIHGDDRKGDAQLETSGYRPAPIHRPALNMGSARAEEEQREREALQKEVSEGIDSIFASAGTLADHAPDVGTWANQMRNTQKSAEQRRQKRESEKDVVPAIADGVEYDAKDLHGLTVGHSTSEFTQGSTTILTLADSSLIRSCDENTLGFTAAKVLALREDSDEDMHLLQNVDLIESRRQADGLRGKRQLELGMGRAGGYAGYDDDEFVELGGAQSAAPVARGSDALNLPATSSVPERQRRRIGFQIGVNEEGRDEHEKVSDLFAAEKGRAISLQPSHADIAASDFLTAEEEAEAELRNYEGRRSKRDHKLKKKDKKKVKKMRLQNKMANDDDDDSVHLLATGSQADHLRPTKGLLEELEETAVSSVSAKSRRRRRREDDEEILDPNVINSIHEKELDTNTVRNEIGKGTADGEDMTIRRSKYDAIMDKGSKRTHEAFLSRTRLKPTAPGASVLLEEEADDAFLNAALAKARRLKLLREMNNNKGSTAESRINDLVAAVRSSGIDTPASVTSSGGTISFAVDETREFTRALRARAEQASRQHTRMVIKTEDIAAPAIKTDEVERVILVTNEERTVNPSEVHVNHARSAELTDDSLKDIESDMNELAKQVKDDDAETAWEGATGATSSVGRGLGNVLNMLRQTGDLTGKNAGREEMRGRAKDERTYEDYQALNLKDVVRIDERSATDKDREFANREIQLEYRDKFGRLLTRKEAYRDLSYQFHGYGSGKRKEEKRQAQITREQASARLSSLQTAEGKAAGTLGALKATQKATGKAFVIHKT